MSIINMLTPLQWVIIALVPPAIIALYFLKLKRQPIEVPSTYLWHRTIEDLHVNSIWQRLRQSLLLLLQLLLLVLLMLACVRPGHQGAEMTGDRFIFLVDTSASMSADDIKPTRLQAAKDRIVGMIDQMETDDVAMIISFSDVARVEQSFTSSRSLLRQKANRIRPTNRPTDLREALRAAAGLANPGRSSDAENINDVQVADALPATLYLFTDGGVSAVPEFSLGNLDPQYIRIGTPAPHNVAIAAFTAEQNPDRPGQLQAFARLENTGTKSVTAGVSLYLNDELIDATEVVVPEEDSRGVSFELQDLDKGLLRLVVEQHDALAIDNTAHTAINPPRRARVLLATPGNEALRLAMATEEVVRVADVALAAPADLETKEHRELAAAGYFDLIIYDQCAAKDMPRANTLCIGRAPPLDTWSLAEQEVMPLIIDVDRVHPLMQYVELGNVTLLEGSAVRAPPGGSTLIDSDIGALLSIAPREGYEDAVMGFEVMGTDDAGRTEPKTDWPIRRSFPVFLMNVVRYLGGVSDSASTASVRPGQPVTLRTESPVTSVRVRSPNRRETEVYREAQNTFVFTDTNQLGVYDVLEGKQKSPASHFAVNLFDSRESDLKPRDVLQLGHDEIHAQRGLQPARKEWWRWLLLAGLVVLTFEWYIYNRRVYL
jgi:hypothetical protein